MFEGIDKEERLAYFLSDKVEGSPSEMVGLVLESVQLTGEGLLEGEGRAILSVDVYEV